MIIAVIVNNNWWDNVVELLELLLLEWGLGRGLW